MARHRERHAACGRLHGDLRAIDEVVRDAVEGVILREKEAIAAARGVTVTFREGHRLKIVRLDPFATGMITQAFEALGLGADRQPSKAGNDAMQLRGNSHCPGEWSDTDDCRLGAEVLYRAVLAIGAEASKDTGGGLG